MLFNVSEIESKCHQNMSFIPGNIFRSFFNAQIINVIVYDIVHYSKRYTEFTILYANKKAPFMFLNVKKKIPGLYPK